jgi:hypothetical protein
MPEGWGAHHEIVNRLSIAAAMVLVAGSVQAQHHQKQHGQSPYADMQSRAVKLLQERIADLKAAAWEWPFR